MLTQSNMQYVYRVSKVNYEMYESYNSGAYISEGGGVI